MGNRLSKIYTRTGDDGSTGLGDGARVAKESLRVEAYGTVDETNSALGVVLAIPELPAEIRRTLIEIQHDLFDLGGELCIPGHVMISADHVATTREGVGPLQRGIAAAQGIHFAGWRRGGGRLPSRPHYLPACGAALLVAGARGKRRSGGAQVSKSPVGFVVRVGAGTGPSERGRRSGLASAELAARLGASAGNPRSSHAGRTMLIGVQPFGVPALQVLDRQRPAKQKPLNLICVPRLQVVPLGFGLHALGHGR